MGCHDVKSQNLLITNDHDCNSIISLYFYNFLRFSLRSIYFLYLCLLN